MKGLKSESSGDQKKEKDQTPPKKEGSKRVQKKELKKSLKKETP
ncbi:hypothetical protein HpVH103_09640 [Helicobacter pylori]